MPTPDWLVWRLRTIFIDEGEEVEGNNIEANLRYIWSILKGHSPSRSNLIDEGLQEEEVGPNGVLSVPSPLSPVQRKNESGESATGTGSDEGISQVHPSQISLARLLGEPQEGSARQKRATVSVVDRVATTEEVYETHSHSFNSQNQSSHQLSGSQKSSPTRILPVSILKKGSVVDLNGLQNDRPQAGKTVQQLAREALVSKLPNPTPTKCPHCSLLSNTPPIHVVRTRDTWERRPTDVRSNYPITIGIQTEQECDAVLWDLLGSLKLPPELMEAPLDSCASAIRSHILRRVGPPPWTESFLRRQRLEQYFVAQTANRIEESQRRMTALYTELSKLKINNAALYRTLQVTMGNPTEGAKKSRETLQQLTEEFDRMQFEAKENVRLRFESDAERRFMLEGLAVSLEEIRRMTAQLQGLCFIARDHNVSTQKIEQSSQSALRTFSDTMFPHQGRKVPTSVLQCPACLQLLESSPFCGMTGARHIESPVVDGPESDALIPSKHTTEEAEFPIQEREPSSFSSAVALATAGATASLRSVESSNSAAIEATPTPVASLRSIRKSATLTSETTPSKSEARNQGKSRKDSHPAGLSDLEVAPAADTVVQLSVKDDGAEAAEPRQAPSEGKKATRKSSSKETKMKNRPKRSAAKSKESSNDHDDAANKPVNPGGTSFSSRGDVGTTLPSNLALSGSVPSSQSFSQIQSRSQASSSFQGAPDPAGGTGLVSSVAEIDVERSNPEMGTHIKEFLTLAQSREISRLKSLIRAFPLSNCGSLVASASDTHLTTLQHAEEQFCEWLDLILPAAVRHKGPSQRQGLATKASVIHLTKELRNLIYAITKRPKGRSTGATLDDAAFQTLAIRISNLEKKERFLKLRIKQSMSERRTVMRQLADFGVSVDIDNPFA